MTIELVLSDKEQRRFWSRVTLPDENGCMLWTGAINSCRYGHGKFAGAYSTAHRVSLRLADGAPASDGLQAAHACRNRHCVAPNHLRWVTQSENEADKRWHGVAAAGERQAHALLTDAQASEIRALFAQGGVTRTELGQRYGVSRKVITKLIAGHTYRSSMVGA